MMKNSVVNVVNVVKVVWPSRGVKLYLSLLFLPQYTKWLHIFSKHPHLLPKNILHNVHHARFVTEALLNLYNTSTIGKQHATVVNVVNVVKNLVLKRSFIFYGPVKV